MDLHEDDRVTDAWLDAHPELVRVRRGQRIWCTKRLRRGKLLDFPCVVVDLESEHTLMLFDWDGDGVDLAAIDPPTVGRVTAALYLVRPRLANDEKPAPKILPGRKAFAFAETET